MIKCSLNLFLCSILFMASSSLSGQKKADVAFVLRGYDGSSYFSDKYAFDVHAKLIMEGMSKLSFGRITTYEIIEHGIDNRSPVELQSVKDVETLQASLDGWPGSKWDWLRSRTDFWLVVPAEYRPIVQESINWMKANKLDFQTWGRETELGKIHYNNVQNNVQRMGPSSAADYLSDLRMPEGFDPKEYDITLVILNSNGDKKIAGGGAQSTFGFFGVLDAKGNKYVWPVDYPLAYIGVTPINQNMYTTSVHEAIHAYGMGTHDLDPNQLTNGDYSIMNYGNLTSYNTLPAWDRYFWTKWLPQSTITKDSTLVKDLKGKELLKDTINKYIYEVIAGDSRGRGGRYKELYDGKWYTYQTDAIGTLTFLDKIDNLKIKPTNFILEVPHTIYEGRKETFRIYSDGENPKTFAWKKNGSTIATTTKEEFVIEKVTAANAGKYEVVISNQNGAINTHIIDVKVVCDPPDAPIIKLNLDGFIVSSAMQNSWFLNGDAINDFGQKIPPRRSGVYTAISNDASCPSRMSNGVVIIISNTFNLKPHEYINLNPNPFKDVLKLEFLIDNTNNINIELFDITGKKVFERLNTPSQSTFEFGNEIKSGIYKAFITVKGKEGRNVVSLMKVD